MHEIWSVRIPRASGRLVAVLALLLLAALPLARLPAAAHADGGYNDITGKNLRLMVDVTGPSGAITSTNVESVPAGLLPQPIQGELQQIQKNPLLSAPLSGFFDSLWSKMLPSACAQIQQTITSQVSGDNHAYNVTCHLATRGSLRAMVQPGGNGQQVLLSYWLGGNDVDFSVTSPVTGCFLCPSDPAYNLKFDAELAIVMPVPSVPCTLTPQAQILVHNADVGAANASAEILDAVATFINFVQGQPTALFQVPEGQADSVQQAVSVSAFTQALGGIEAACSKLGQVGLTSFSAAVDPTNGLSLHIGHPQGTIAGLADAIAEQNGRPKLIGGLLTAVGSSEVNQDGAIGVHGAGFNLPETNAVRIDWSDQNLGTATKSTVTWGPQGQQQNAVTLQPAQTSWEADNLQPGAAYQFQVQDCDALTCSAPSAVLTVTTAGAGSDQVAFYLDGDAQHPLAEPPTTVAADGSFSARVTIPSSATTGSHVLSAAVNGETATLPITVVGAGESLPPVLRAIDELNEQELRAVAGGQVTLQGANFAPGEVSLSVSSPKVEALGTATVAADGSFQSTIFLPYDVIGQVTITASQKGQGKTVKAMTTLSVEAAPQ